jgi:hypothetical protein
MHLRLHHFLKSMNRKLTFGEFEGRSFEWLFFNAPWYADWLHKNRILETRWDYDEADRACFTELHRRASALAGKCPYCNERHVVRRALSMHRGGLGMTTFCCGECRPINEGLVIHEKPSFFMRPEQWTRVDQKNLTSTIKELYIGRGNLTQRRMEVFFKDDERFWYSTPDFFTEKEVQQ